MNALRNIISKTAYVLWNDNFWKGLQSGRRPQNPESVRGIWQKSSLNVILCFALVAFISTVMYARHIERDATRDDALEDS